ncbi:methyltransferase type 11 [Bisporella sp. PMI_857]|nr:methyltransferase type 11 [Bisporella sp. PMI_857]
MAEQQVKVSTEQDASAVKKEHDPKRIAEEGYNRIADTYLEWTNRIPSPRLSYLEKLIPLLPATPATKVLELGCGAGVPSTQLLAQHFSVVGNDISASQIALARTHLPASVELIHGDMAGLSFAPDSLDAVVGFYSVFHLAREEQRVMFGKIGEWVREGGYLLVNLSGEEFESMIMEGWLGADMFWSSWDGETYRRLVEDAGFEVLEAEIKTDMENGDDGVKFLWIFARKIN